METAPPRGRARLLEFAGETAVYGLGRQVVAVATLVLVPVLTRALGPEAMGLQDVVGRGCMLVLLAVGLGMDTANLVLFQQTDGSERRRLLATSLLLRFLLGAPVFALAAALAPVVAERFLHGAGAVPVIRVAALANFLQLLSASTVELLRLARRKWAFAAMTAGAALVHIVATLVYVLVLRWGIAGFFAGIATAHACVFPVALWLGRDLVGTAVGKDAARRLLGLGLPAVPGALAEGVFQSFDRYAVLALSSLREEGIYAVAATLASALSTPAGAFQGAWGPFALSIQKDEHAGRTFARIGRMLALVMLSGAVGLALLAPEVLGRVFATREFEGGGAYVSWLVFGPVFLALTYLFAIGLYMAEATGALSLALLAGLSTLVAGVLVLVPRYGAIGAAASVALARGVLALGTLGASRRVRPIAFDHGRMLVALLAAMGAIAGGQGLPLAGRLGLLGVALVLLPVVLVKPEELRALRPGPAGQNV